jgi:hypothetical protein
MKSCFRCRQDISTKDRIGRRDTCPHCGADLHCCLNCIFYDTHYADACREPQAEPVLDKDVGNFCEYFTLADRQTQPSVAATTARAQLEALFKKKS